MSRCMLEATNDNCGAPGRFETLGIASAVAGTWKLRVESYSGAGSFEATVICGPRHRRRRRHLRRPRLRPAWPSSRRRRPRSTWRWTDTSGDEDGFTLQRCQGGELHDVRHHRDAARRRPRRTATPAWPPGRRTPTGCAPSTPAGRRPGARPARATQAPPQTAPAAPTGLVAVAASATRVNLTWVDRSSNETGFRVLRCVGTKCTPRPWSRRSARASTTYADLTVARARPTATRSRPATPPGTEQLDDRQGDHAAALSCPGAQARRQVSSRYSHSSTR